MHTRLRFAMQSTQAKAAEHVCLQVVHCRSAVSCVPKVEVYESEGGRNFRAECWEECGLKSGNCEWCGDYTPGGTHMACCRHTWGDNTEECVGRGPHGYHACYWPASAGNYRGDLMIEWVDGK